MQYILTEEEYIKLKNQAEASETIVLNTFYRDSYRSLQKEVTILTRKNKELQEKYDKLLVFGVSRSNERLKGNK